MISDNVNHPAHYTQHPCGLEIIEITKHENFCIGNALKYIFRHRHKGAETEDLQKAIKYLEFEINRLREADTALQALERYSAQCETTETCEAEGRP